MTPSGHTEGGGQRKARGSKGEKERKRPDVVGGRNQQNPLPGLGNFAVATAAEPGRARVEETDFGPVRAKPTVGMILSRRERKDLLNLRYLGNPGKQPITCGLHIIPSSAFRERVIIRWQRRRNDSPCIEGLQARKASLPALTHVAIGNPAPGPVNRQSILPD